MNYDFSTVLDRTKSNAVKWKNMKSKKLNVQKTTVPLSIADMEFKSPPEIIEGLKQYLDQNILGYIEAGSEYHEAMIAWMKKRHAWEIKKEWILFADGIVPAFHTAIKAFTKKGEGVIVLTPVYYPFFQAIEINQRKVVASELIQDQGYYKMNFPELEKLVKDPNNKMILFCSPHNPVGRVWSKAELEKIGQLCIANNVLFLSDEIHSDLIMPGYHHTVFANISEAFANQSIICTAPSKTFNLAALQVSNVIIPNQKLKRIFLQENYTTGRIRINALGMKAGELAYQKGENWLEELLQVIKFNEEIVRNFMGRYFPEVIIAPLEGTYLLWLDFRAWGMNKIELENFMVQEAELFLDEGYIFGAGGEGFERLNLACPTVILEAALLRLKQAREKYLK